MRILNILLPTLIASSALAQSSSDELAKLRESYTRAVERATLPITTTYVTELKKLMEKRTKAGELDAALAVKSELETVTKSRAGATPPGSSSIAEAAPAAETPVPIANPAVTKGKRLTRPELKEIEKRFVGCLWVDVKRDWALYFFRKDGTFTRVLDTRTGNKRPEKWQLREDGVVTWGTERTFTFPSAEQGQLLIPQGAVTDEVNLKIVPGGKDPG